jgi:hypothetical protein
MPGTGPLDGATVSAGEQLSAVLGDAGAITVVERPIAGSPAGRRSESRRLAVAIARFDPDTLGRQLRGGT